MEELGILMSITTGNSGNKLVQKLKYLMIGIGVKK